MHRIWSVHQVLPGCLSLPLCFRALASAHPRSAAPARRLEAIRTSRLAIDPAEERALLSEAQSVAAGRAALAAGAKAPGRGRGRGRARGGRGESGGRAERPLAVTGVPHDGSFDLRLCLQLHVGCRLYLLCIALCATMCRAMTCCKQDWFRVLPTWCCAACPAEDAGGGGGEGAAGVEPDGLAAGVRFCALEGREEGLLWDLAPAFVVNYDPDIAFVRQLEARGPPRSLRSLAP